MKDTHQVIGHSVSRVDAWEKVTGKAKFASDLVIPGMAYAKLWRSPVAHARLRSVDVGSALRLPGVICALTGADLTDLDPYYGPAFRDQPILPIDRIRYAGEPVAAIVAEEEALAASALDAVTVDYEELPAASTLDEALAPGAPRVQEVFRRAGYFRDLASLKPMEGTNICHHYHYERGDVAQGFAQADEVVEETYTFPMVHHYSMEPHAVIARWDGDGITLWASTQHPFPVRRELSDIFHIPLAKIQLIVPYLGAAYGNKSYTKLEPLTVTLARKAGRPVRLALTVEEAFTTVRRAAVRYRIRTGVRRDGTIVARQCTAHYQLGAYADVGPRVVQKSGYTAAGPYRIPHVQIDAYGVLTHTVPSVAFRGYGVPQLAWAYESHMDVIAKRLGLDPLEVRLKNLLTRGEEMIPGDLPVDCDFAEGIRKAAEAVGWGRTPTSPRQGRGLACVIKAPLAPSIATALVRMHADGSVTLLTSSVEVGQGARTVLSQMVAEELGVAMDAISVAQPGESMSPYDQATSSSRSTALMGLSVQAAARDLSRQIREIGAKLFGSTPDALHLRDGALSDGTRFLPYPELIAQYFGLPGGELIGRGMYRGERGGPLGGIAPFWEVAMGAAEVEVDEETGALHLKKYVSVADVGKAINPLQCEAQDEGAAVMGLGHTLFEQMIYEDGQLLNGNLIDYRVPVMADLPDDLRSLLVENGDGPGPYGAKGMGESGIMPVAPAVANALAAATGVRIHDLPLTPERVCAALHSSEERVKRRKLPLKRRR